MRSLKSSECIILPLVLKKKWYDLVASGIKKEEYRDFKPFWESRIERCLSKCNADKAHPKPLVVAFSLGYKKADMFFVTQVSGIERGTCHSEWGEPESPHYIISLLERINLKGY